MVPSVSLGRGSGRGRQGRRHYHSGMGQRRSLDLPASNPPTHVVQKEAGEDSSSSGPRAGGPTQASRSLSISNPLASVPLPNGLQWQLPHICPSPSPLPMLVSVFRLVDAIVHALPSARTRAEPWSQPHQGLLMKEDPFANIWTVLLQAAHMEKISSISIITIQLIWCFVFARLRMDSEEGSNN